MAGVLPVDGDETLGCWEPIPYQQFPFIFSTEKHMTEDPEVTRMLLALDDALKRIDACYIALDQARQEIEEAKTAHLLWAEQLKKMTERFGSPRPAIADYNAFGMRGHDTTRH